MNTNSNVYTVVYTTVVCVLVAAILAIVSQSLKSKQEANEKAETISQILTAAQFGDKESWTDNNATIDFYKEKLEKAVLVNASGEITGELSRENATIYNLPDLKKQNYNVLDASKAAQIEIPIYIFGNGISVVPVYGAGLWGPVWGYIALEKDLETIRGAYFDHSGETPGLGGKIKDDPSFRAKFAGKCINYDDVVPFAIVKGGVPEGRNNAIDAISGATMTSNGLSDAIAAWISAYKPYVAAGKAAATAAVAAQAAAEEEVETVND